jgi:hypothetical protein
MKEVVNERLTCFGRLYFEAIHFRVLYHVILFYTLVCACGLVPVFVKG